MRITIIGNCASGKSTLARRISESLAIPHLQLDRLWFKAGGHRLKRGDVKERDRVRSEIKSRVEKFIEQEAWVSDGFYSRVQPSIAERADQVVFLDISLNRRVFNHLKRVLSGNRHPELSLWEDLRFTGEIVTRTFTKGPRMWRLAQEHHRKLVRLGSYRQVESYLQGLEGKSRRSSR